MASASRSSSETSRPAQFHGDGFLREQQRCLQPMRRMTAPGACKLDGVACATNFGAMPACISPSLFAVEKAVRSSIILGFFGRGWHRDPTESGL